MRIWSLQLRLPMSISTTCWRSLYKELQNKLRPSRNQSIDEARYRRCQRLLRPRVPRASQTTNFLSFPTKICWTKSWKKVRINHLKSQTRSSQIDNSRMKNNNLNAYRSKLKKSQQTLWRRKKKKNLTKQLRNPSQIRLCEEQDPEKPSLWNTRQK